MTGTPGEADKKAEVNFAELPAAEAWGNFTVRAQTERPEVDLPHDLPVREEEVAPEEGLPPDADAPDEEEQEEEPPGDEKDRSASSQNETSDVTDFRDQREARSRPRAFLAPPTVTASFDAVDFNTGFIPPDVGGAAGPNHLVAVHNGTVRIQNKAGGVLSTVTLDAFWSAVSGTGGTFDPKVLYDASSSRWIMTACDDALSATSGILIGVSQSDDPTGNWTLRKVTVGAADGAWADYPSIGVNGLWIVVQVNMAIGATFARSHIYVFDKNDLLMGRMGTFILFSLLPEYGGSQVPVIGNSGNPRIMYLLQDWNGNSSGAGYIRLWRIRQSTVISPPDPPRTVTRLFSGFLIGTNNPWDSQAPGGAAIGPQLGSTAMIDLGDSRIRNDVYAKPGVQNAYIYVVQTAFLPAGGATRSAVQFWAIRTNYVVEQFARIDDPTGGTFFAYPSLAVTALHSVFIGFSSFSAQRYPGATFAFRSGSDPPSSLQMGGVLRSGQGPYLNVGTGTQNRWGDYSSTSLDPGGTPSIWTIQEYARSPVGTGNQSGRWGTWWSNVEFFEIG